MAMIVWPHCVLRPQQVAANLVPFTRSGGATLGGISPSYRTDLGFWSIDYMNVILQNRHKAQWQTWQAIRQKLGGRSGLIAVPVRSALSAPYVSGSFEPMPETKHSDGSTFSDGSLYVQGAISVKSVGVTAIGATTIRLRVIHADSNLVGVRFSCNHALYETGPVISVDGDVWEVPISPTVRELIPADCDLEFDRPTCLCHLADDRGMDVTQEAVSRTSYPSLRFVEATDYWNALALGLV
ncbi:hypothetical protein [Rhizobium rhizophilum]|uniref:Uncharacterized protein n=1 Tax=Rhizobium rhizophilum TaxID=1850373 RepID=A0ABY2QTW5_9HYPH|nr:hypothetical protein [Rhizobium rhizophilum]THV13727.1 hypothetical protein E9677_12515 [Rhizobium rhizophilum]